MYGPSCPLRAELSTGRVVHGPSCPGIPAFLRPCSDLAAHRKNDVLLVTYIVAL